MENQSKKSYDIVVDDDEDNEIMAMNTVKTQFKLELNRVV